MGSRKLASISTGTRKPEQLSFEGVNPKLKIMRRRCSNRYIYIYSSYAGTNISLQVIAILSTWRLISDQRDMDIFAKAGTKGFAEKNRHYVFEGSDARSGPLTS